MVQFTKLRLTGFKSFVDGAEVHIEPGMTGVVGPNGCGKSNLVEALRWVMGETSAKQMRGGEMDDVIFGGTANRPARNIAEVGLSLDNRRRTAPAMFNDCDELEVTRRIERGEGSLYKVNGREVRARDVQLLFADAATGSRSTAMVSQGRVGALINARASERRSLLEEAAGIAGLHSRRHEAELRLKAAEQNLSRLEDVLTTLDTQLQGLKRQARQAARYRSLTEQIRSVEAVLLHLRWQHAIGMLDAARDAKQMSEGKVAELTGLVAEASARQAECAANLPPLRQAEAEAAARLQRLVVAREQLDAEEGRLAATKAEVERRLAQIDSDASRESARAADAAGAVMRLEDERAHLMGLGEDEGLEQDAAAEAVELASEAVALIEAELARVMEEVAAADAERAAALRQVAEAESRRQRLGERLSQIAQQKEAATADGVDPADLADAEMDLESALEFLEESRSAAEDADRRRQQAQAARDQARDSLQGLAASRARLRAEADALKAVLNQGLSGDQPPVLDQIATVPGYEAALGAALGDDLSAPLEGSAPIRWTALPPLGNPPALPAGVDALSKFVTAPPALARRLSQVGVVADAGRGDALRSDLAVGQRLVTRDGDLWRWDGFTAHADAPSAAAVRLQQRNRLKELEAQIEDAELGVAEAEETAQTASEIVEEATIAERQAREDVKRAEAEAAKAREEHGKLSARAEAAKAKLEGLDAQAAQAQADLAEAEAAEVSARATLAAFPEDGQGGRERVASLRADLAEKRSRLIEAKSNLDRVVREQGDRKRRLESIESEITSWVGRADAAKRHQDELAERRAAALEELERLSAAPLEIAEKREHLLLQVAEADEARAACARTLADAEAFLAESDKALREAEHALASCREDRVRREAAVEAAAAECRTVAQRIAERLDVTPEQLAAQVEGQELGAIEELGPKLERLMRERDAMGPVNLRAEQEAAELEEQIAGLQAERADLVQAIAKLRQAINELNREGRERLLASFEEVNGHFTTLFTRLFGGGRAHLELTESDDPLQAGLEIMASPPGKRLQILSLLSGGEQALTAIALLFAVFMVNPAPICVLDEVDAPLDDANVDRFCSLVADIAKSSQTRFLVITHHRMTMARMDRLYGVTMAERGVSTLVSVDLNAAEELREPV